MRINFKALPREVQRDLYETINSLELRGIKPSDERYQNAIRKVMSMHRDELEALGIDVDMFTEYLLYLISNFGASRILELLIAKSNASKSKLISYL